MNDPFAEALKRLATIPAEATGYDPLRFFTQPIISARRDMPRRFDRIDQTLMERLRRLVGGLERWPLYVWSREAGTGKTSAALAMLDHCALGWDSPVVDATDANDVISGFIDATALPRVLRSVERRQVHFIGTGATLTEPDLWGQIYKRKLVVIDDVRRPSDKEMQLGDDIYTGMKRVLDNRVGRPLIVTGNLSPKELSSVWDERIADRILCGAVIEATGSSRRVEGL